MYSVQVTSGDTKAVSTCQLFIHEDMPLERPEEQFVLPSFVEKLQDTEVDDGSEYTLQVCLIFFVIMEVKLKVPLL